MPPTQDPDPDPDPTCQEGREETQTQTQTQDPDPDPDPSHAGTKPNLSLPPCCRRGAMAPQKKVQKKTEQGREENDNEAGRQAVTASEPFEEPFGSRLVADMTARQAMTSHEMLYPVQRPCRYPVLGFIVERIIAPLHTHHPQMALYGAYELLVGQIQEILGIRREDLKKGMSPELRETLSEAFGQNIDEVKLLLSHLGQAKRKLADARQASATKRVRPPPGLPDPLSENDLNEMVTPAQGAFR